MLSSPDLSDPAIASARLDHANEFRGGQSAMRTSFKARLTRCVAMAVAIASQLASIMGTIAVGPSTAARTIFASQGIRGRAAASSNSSTADASA
ncbi:hypothetical protein ASG53_14705 [Sanguibacter sp. Leaf3]|nr:hypothetical protein ASG53_14705 [Sanguibacter sp. Leaf3]